MKASYNWLRALVPGLSATPDQLAERMTLSGLEVEEVVRYGAASDQVIVAEVRRVAPHPSRDRLTLVTVDRGGAEQTVVCGAPNVPEPGRKVVLAPLGATLPAVGLQVAPRAIAGVQSEGMLCSEIELGLIDGSGKGDGIVVLPADFEAPNGTPLSKALPASSDTIFEISVTPNRPDALGHVGLAREVAALYALEFAAPEPDAPARVAPGARIEQLASVQIEDTERCPHYGAAVVVDVTVGASPLWLRYRLESLGVRSISNIVDVTNLVLLEHGHPIHAFDLDTLTNGRVVVRRAVDGEELTTLDGVVRSLSDDDLLITDGVRPIALAGVMGGNDSEISESSRRVLIECAYFAPRGVRRTSRRHGLHSEASHRFERGIDPRGVPDVLAQAATLITQLGHGKAVTGTIVAGVSPADLKRIVLRLSRLEALLGLSVAADTASAILSRLGCEVQRSEAHPDELAVVAPSFRPDLTREEDLIEEVMRVHGIERVPAELRPVRPLAGRSKVSLRDRVRGAAAALGLSEALTYGFVAPRDLAAVHAPEACVSLKNPLTEERSVMRTSLLPGLLEAVRRATRHGVPNVRLFSVGRTFHPRADQVEPLPLERSDFCAVMCGQRGSGIDRREPLDVYDAKGLAEELVARVLQRPLQLQQAAVVDGRSENERLLHLHPRGAAELLIDGQRVGCLGPLHPDVADAFDLSAECLLVEFDLDALTELHGAVPKFRAIPALPAISRDVSLLVHDDVEAAKVSHTIATAAGELCESVELFDVFRGKDIPAEHRALAFRMVFRDPKATSEPHNARTLTDKEVERCYQQVVQAAKQQVGAVVRGA